MTDLILLSSLPFSRTVGKFKFPSNSVMFTLNDQINIIICDTFRLFQSFSHLPFSKLSEPLNRINILSVLMSERKNFLNQSVVLCSFL